MRRSGKNAGREETTTNDRCAFIRRHRPLWPAAERVEHLPPRRLKHRSTRRQRCDALRAEFNKAAAMAAKAEKSAGKIYIGVGGWNFAPWRGVFYPEGLAQAKELELRVEPSDVDRDQRHLLRLAEAGKLSQMGGDRARRLHVLGQGAALRHQPARPRRGRRLHQALPRFRRAWNCATGSARCCGSSRRPKNSTPATSANSWNYCRARADGRSCVTSSRCATRASARRSSSR